MATPISRRHAARASAPSERGQTIVLLAVSMVALAGMAGLAIDVGTAFRARRDAQQVADLAAAAGAQEQIRIGVAPAPFATVVTSYAAKNGFSSAKGDTIVTANPPTSGPQAGNTNAYEVRITRPVPTTLLRALGRNTMNVEGHATALIKKVGLGILLLHPTAKGALNMKGGAKLQLKRGLVYVNSNDMHGIKLDGNTVLTSQLPAAVVGNVLVAASATLSPAPITGAAVYPDPLASLPVPPLTLPTRAGTPGVPVLYEPANNAVLCPGVYYGGISVKTGRKVTFDTCGLPASECVYYLWGGGLTTASGSEIVAKGVMIYNARNALGNCEDVDLHQSSKVTLTAPKSGTYQGLALFQDRGCTKTINIYGHLLEGIVGELYAASGQVILKGQKGKTNALKVSMVVSTLEVFQGDATQEPDVLLNGTVGASSNEVVLAL
jgi:hypothetical protein